MLNFKYVSNEKNIPRGLVARTRLGCCTATTTLFDRPFLVSVRFHSSEHRILGLIECTFLTFLIKSKQNSYAKIKQQSIQIEYFSLIFSVHCFCDQSSLIFFSFESFLVFYSSERKKIFFSRRCLIYKQYI